MGLLSRRRRLDNKDDGGGSTSGDGGDMCSTRKVVKSQCKTEEVEPGKFIRKCEKTEEILRECVGKPTQVLQSNIEYTEDDVTEQMAKGEQTMEPPVLGLFEFPGLRGDIDAIERQLGDRMGKFFDAAEEMRSSLFDAFGDLYSRGSSRRQGVPIEGGPEKKDVPSDTRSGDVDLSALARDV